MLTQFKNIAMQSRNTLVEDAIGLCALVVMLVVALHFSSFI